MHSQRLLGGGGTGAGTASDGDRVPQQRCHSDQGSIPTPGSWGAPGAEVQWVLWVSTPCSLAVVLLLVPSIPGAQGGFICPGCLSLLRLGSLFSLPPSPSSFLLGAAILGVGKGSGGLS